MLPPSHRPVCCVPACVVGSGDGQLRFDVVGDDGVDDVTVDLAVRPEVDAHPVSRRGSSRHSLFDTNADEPGMIIEAALPAAERQQVGILDKRLLQTLAEAVGIEAGLLCLDNDIKVGSFWVSGCWIWCQATRALTNAPRRALPLLRVL